MCSSARLAAGLGLAPQVADVDAERVRPGAEVVAPDALEDLRAREHLARVLHEQGEQVELGAREVDPAAAAAHLVGDRVEHEVAEPQRRAVLAGRAAQQRPQPRLELLERERLDEVVVGARVQAGDAVVDRVARGEHQHRRAVAGVAQPPAHLEPVDVRHRDVEHDGVGRRAAGQPVERLAAVGRQLDVIGLEPQRALERGPHGGLVVDHEDAGHVPMMTLPGPRKSWRRPLSRPERDPRTIVGMNRLLSFVAGAVSVGAVVGVLAIAGAFDGIRHDRPHARPPHQRTTTPAQGDERRRHLLARLGRAWCSCRPTRAAGSWRSPAAAAPPPGPAS